MKLLLLCILILTSITLRGQDTLKTDSVNVRVLNKGKHYIKEHILTIDGHDYLFSDVWKGKYSEYQKLPYLWTSNKSKTTVIVKKIFKYDLWLTTLLWPDDHVGEERLIDGNYRIEVRTKKKGDHLEVETEIIKE